MKIIIPAYQPGVKLLQLITEIKQSCQLELVIVDDGSGVNYLPIFVEAEKLGSKVLHHPMNLGKGAALKTGFQYLLAMGEKEGVVCADCDGQHSVEDIMKIAVETLLSNKTVVLGIRQFNSNVPLRSRLGNSITAKIFTICAGYQLQDTQTGLRGYQAAMLPWLCQLPGERYEYELNILLQLKLAGYAVKEIAIKTIYEQGNKNSHFRTLIDSFRVYLAFLKFTFSSILSGLLDFGLLLFFASRFTELLPAVVFARLISASFNYTVNKYYVFGGLQKKRTSIVKYVLLVLVIMLLNYVFLETLVLTGISLVVAKLLTETLLFMLSYLAQKKLVFIK